MSWFKNMKIVYKLIVLVSVSILSLLVVGYTGYHYLLTFHASLNEMYTGNLRGVAALNENRSMGQGITSDILDILVTVDPNRANDDSKDIEKRVKIVEENLKIYEGTGLNGFEADKMKELKSNWEKYGAARKQVVDLALANKKAEAYDFYNQSVRPAANATQDNLRDLAKYNQEEAAALNVENAEKFVAANKITISVIFLATVVLLSLGGLICRIISRNLKLVVAGIQEVAGGNLAAEKLAIDTKDETGQVADALTKMVQTLQQVMHKVHSSVEHLVATSDALKTGAEQTADASTQVATSIAGVASGAESQVEVIQKTSQTIEQMSAGIEEIAAHAANVSQATGKTAQTAVSGGQAVQEAVHQIASAETVVTHSAQVVARLGERSKEIGQIVDTISGIAGQTNLLALNAAIEAARAGEQGKGFAVVADEVRKLAEQSESAAKQIADLIAQIQAETDNAVTVMNKGTAEVHKGAEVVNIAGKSFNDILSMIEEVTKQVNDITGAIDTMAAGSQQVVTDVRAVSELSQTASSHTQSVAAAIEEQSATMEEAASLSNGLAKMAEDLREEIAVFKL
ncbi:MAG: methyl-accepting chemotaxis protein [Pelosinus sp.]|nr:methyl-accepting chemotaxis protein [Pelosinus sp.]